jgi:hypothetical protein
VTKGAQPLFAVVRVDRPDTVDDFFREPQGHVTVKEVLPSLEEAQQEAERLNNLNGDEGCVYFAQATRFFSSGRMSASGG